MRRVDFSLNGRVHSLNCAEGQEPRLLELAAYVDRRMTEVTGGAGSEIQGLIATCMVLADELLEVRASLAHAGTPPVGGGAATSGTSAGGDEAGVADSLDRLARRVEEIAASLERA
jgi:cell division protein ZapA